MDVRSHVRTIDENGIRITISINRATPVLTKNYVEMNMTRNIHPPAQTIVLKHGASVLRASGVRS